MNEIPVEAESRGDYVVWDMRDWTGDEEVLADIETAWLEEHSDSTVESSVVLLNDDIELGPDFQTHISERWSALTSDAGIEELVFVTDRVTALAVKANMDVDGVAVKAETSLSEAEDVVGG
jgi:trans-2-enoyl-CoA reductase